MRVIDSLDLEPAAEQLSRLAQGVGADQLDDPTPCEDMAVRDLVSHLLMATRFSAAAGTGLEPAGESEVAVDADGGWKSVLAQRAQTLAAVWAAPEAWVGRAAAGGVETSAQEGGRAAAMELVLHGWDLAVATDQPFTADGPAVEAVLELMQEWADAEDRELAFGPIISVPADAAPLHRALGLSGRDPAWVKPPDSH